MVASLIVARETGPERARDREENRTHGRSRRSGSARKSRLARAIFHNEKESHSGKIQSICVGFGRAAGCNGAPAYFSRPTECGSRRERDMVSACSHGTDIREQRRRQALPPSSSTPTVGPPPLPSDADDRPPPLPRRSRGPRCEPRRRMNERMKYGYPLRCTITTRTRERNACAWST